jgi:prepilin-type N-terminal cleavage/methylation domain-containing protein
MIYAYQKGFTLIEVMVSLGVMGMIAISIWAATSQTTKARNIVETAHDEYHQVRIAFDALSRDLSSTFLSFHRGPVDPSHDTVFIGTDGGDSDRIDFAAFSHNRRYFDANESDQAEISYYLDDDPEISGVKNLIKRESAVLDKDPLRGGHRFVLLHNVEKFDLQYYDMVSKEWLDEWDTTQALGKGSVLPTQVRVKLVINERRGGPKMNRMDEQYVQMTYGTQISIPMRTPILLPFFIPGPPIAVDR